MLSTAQAASAYRASGRINAARMPLVVVAVLLFAMALAVAMELLFAVGVYLVLAVPAVGAALLALVHARAMRVGHMRSPAMAAMLGMVAGLAMYLGYFQADMIRHRGWSYLPRVDLLPRFIDQRMHSDLIRDRILRSGGGERTGVDTSMNWVLFSIELGICAVVPAMGGWVQARRPYCERCRNWMRQSVEFFPPGSADFIIQAITSDYPAQLLRLTTIRPRPNAPNTRLIVEYCVPPAAVDTVPCPVYATIRGYRNSYAAGFHWIDVALGKRLWGRHVVSKLQIAGLLRIFPVLKPWADEAAIREARSVAALFVAGRESNALAHAGAVIIAEDAPRPAARLVLTPKHIIRGFLLNLVPILFVVPAVLVFIAGILVTTGVLRRVGSVNLVRWGPHVGMAGLAFLCIIIYCVARRITVLRDRFYYRLARAEILARPDRWVEPDDPSAVFVEMLPRENPRQAMLNHAGDVGFLTIVEGEIIFEGDIRRYRIPVATVVRCAIERVTDVKGNPRFCTVVINAADGTLRLDLPFRPYYRPWRSGQRASARNARRLLAVLQASTGAAQFAPPV
jgi:hypothetical protein